MTISRLKKESIVEKMREVIRDAQTVVFVRFSGVTAEEADALRASCADERVGYTVVKKTLIKKAFENAGTAGNFPVLDGEVAIAYGSDMFAPARLIGEQSEKLDGRLEIVGGVFENTFIGRERMCFIADIPPVETLYVQFLTVIRSPVRGLALVLGQIADTK